MMDAKKTIESTTDELRKQIREIEEEMQSLLASIEAPESVQTTIRDRIHEIEFLTENLAVKIAAEGKKRDAGRMKRPSFIAKK